MKVYVRSTVHDDGGTTITGVYETLELAQVPQLDWRYLDSPGHTCWYWQGPNAEYSIEQHHLTPVSPGDPRFAE